MSGRPQYLNDILHRDFFQGKEAIASFLEEVAGRAEGPVGAL